MSSVTYASPHGELRAHLARPEGDGPWPGVVLVHDAFGTSRDLRMGGGFPLLLAPLRGAAERLERTLDSLGIANDVKEYPAAGHSFMNDHGRLMVLLRVMGVGYEAEAAEDAWRRILAFFGRHLHGSA